MNAIDRPALRARLRALHGELGSLLDALVAVQPTFAGVVYQLKTRCGKPRCVCLEGQLHTAWCVSWSEGGRRKLRTVPPEALKKLQALAERYRELRRLRARLAAISADMLKSFDRLERSLRVPPSRALPRRNKGGS